MIKKISIKNFRSIKEAIVESSELTIFVGCNDEGKSNILRSLDLFFNHDKPDGYILNWQRDYCAFAKKIRNKAEQIEIEIQLQLPSSFNIKDEIIWKKTYRKFGLHQEDIFLADKSELPSRSKSYAFLKSIRYDYVPAIKGPEYFEKLLSSVHDMLDSTVQSEIRTAADQFTKRIRKHTSGILSELESQLGIKSEIALPSDLKQLFSELEFQSTSEGHRVSLSQRGDGIKVRHIPVILRWLAIQANHLSSPGRPRVFTIWGYEEPENNLEIKKCFELADYFIDTSKSIQILITTHSPAFYSEFRSNSTPSKTTISEVKLEPQLGTTITPKSSESEEDIYSLHSSVGFLDLIEPHITKWKEESDRLSSLITEEISRGGPTIFVEGPSDKEIIDTILKKHFKSLTIKVRCADSFGGGHPWVKDMLIAWHHSRPKNRAIGLFDDDDAESSINEFKEIIENRVKNQKSFKHKMTPAGPALELRKIGIKVPLAIEEICPQEIWEEANEKGMLEKRKNLISIYDFKKTDTTFDDWIRDKIKNKTLLMIATHKPSDKKKFSHLVKTHIEKSTYDFNEVKSLIATLVQKIT